MTIIAYDGRSICADKAVYKGALYIHDYEKIKTFELANGISVILALSGDLAVIEAKEASIEKYLGVGNLATMDECIDVVNSLMSDPDNLLDGILVIKQGGVKRVYQLNNVNMLQIPAHLPYTAGNPDGQLVVMGALKAGASAKDAVAIACRALNLARCSDPDTDLTTVII